jgi:hypothetical protein
LIGMARKPLVIRSDADLTAVLKRAGALMGYSNCGEEERRSAEITDAGEVYTDSMHLLRTRRYGDAPKPAGSS